MTDGYQKSVQALIKKIQLVAIIVAVIIVAGVVFSSISKWKISEEEELTSLVSEKIVFTPPLKLTDAIEGASYSYSFCRPESARSGATCGGLAGATENPYGGNPPYSFSHQFGVGFIPTGLALELNGLLRGTPTLPGPYTFGVCVTDLYKEICKTTSLTVRPKLEQLEERVEEQVEEQLEEVSPSVKIESVTTALKFWHYDLDKKSGCMCTIKISGTATLPVTERGYSTSVVLGRCDKTRWRVHPRDCSKDGYVSSLTCPNWDVDLFWWSGCVRTRPDQPATGEWSTTFSDSFGFGDEKTYFVVAYMNAEPIIWDSVTVSPCCVP